MPELASTAKLFAHPTRASIVTELMGGVPLPSGALALRAGVSPSTASNHLAVLVAGHVVRSRQEGRWRLYELADSDVASLVEALNLFSDPPTVKSLNTHTASRQMRFARSCYDHLAGQLAINLVDAFMARDWLIVDIDQRPITVSAGGKAALERIGIECPESRTSRPFLRGCVDWTERREHLAGELGSAVLTHMLDRGWLQRRGHNRSLHLTDFGSEALAKEIGLDCATEL